MYMIVILFLLNFSLPSFSHDCTGQLAEDELKSQWKDEVDKVVRTYGRFSEYSIENFEVHKDELKASVELHKLKRVCKKFEYKLSQDSACKGQVKLTSITNCQRTP